MNSSKPKPGRLEPYSQYFVETRSVTPHENKPNTTQSHKRKSSQVSTVSCKSKPRNDSLHQKQIPNRTLNKHKSHYFVSVGCKTQKNTKSAFKLSLHRKQFSLDKNTCSTKNKTPLTSRKQKLQLHTQRKTKLNTPQNLTSRYINYDLAAKIDKNQPESQKLSHGSFVVKSNFTDEKRQSSKKITPRGNFMLPKFKLKEKKLQLVISRCSQVMTEYYEKINILKKQNQYLKWENQELKKQNAQSC